MSSNNRDNNSTNGGNNNNLPISVSHSTDTNETNNETNNNEPVESPPSAVELPVAANDLQLPGVGTLQRGEVPDEFSNDYDGDGDTSIVLRGSGNNGGIRTSSRGKVFLLFIQCMTGINDITF